MLIELTSLHIVVLAFLLEVVDASFGGGYGTILSPLLLMIGFDPLRVVPAILFSQLVGDFSAAFFHHEFKNVDLKIGAKSFRISMILVALSSVGSLISIVVAMNLPRFYLSLYIGALVAATGAIVLTTINKKLSFSWGRLMILGSLAAFNKGISGGGYGPIVTGGQIITGVEAKSAIGITSLAEGFVCIIALLGYVFIGRTVDWTLALMLSIGVAFSAPVSAYLVRRIENRKLKLIIGIFTLILGIATMLRIVSA